jgi:Protein of unknown function (DUF2778)
MWTYSQSTGEMEHDGVLVGTGYSGLGLDKDQPDDQDVVGMGPIPEGQWIIGNAATSPTLGPLAMPLFPDGGTETFGRSQFFIHGDSLEHPGQASHGCIVLDHNTRQAIIDSGDKALTVGP